MRKSARALSICLIAVLGPVLTPSSAEAGWTDLWRDGVAATRAAERTLREQAADAILAGGVLLYRHRHAVAGAALGCVAGSVVATTSTLGASLATGGASLTAAAPAAALGCGLGALGGAAIGRDLDRVYEEP